MFKGVYEKADNDSYLHFESGQVLYQTTDNNVTRTYRVDGDLINIKLNSSVNREDSGLVMRNQHEGAVLTCNRCPAMLLSNIWTLVDKPLKGLPN